MSYIIGSKCVSVCDTACVTICPVDCIHGPIDKSGAGSEVDSLRDTGKIQGLQLYIDPDTCIDCGACIPECPPDAIFENEFDAIAANEKDFVHKNYAFFDVEIPNEFE